MAPKRKAALRRRPARSTKDSGRPKIPPAGFRTVTAYLSVEGGTAAMEFYQRAFGAKELRRQTLPNGALIHGRLRIGDSIVMLSDAMPGGFTSGPQKLGTTTVTLHLYVRDVDALWARAVAAGARVLMPLDNQFWGERYGQLADPFGHHWSLAMPVKMSAAERKAKQEHAMGMFSAGEHPTAPA